MSGRTDNKNGTGEKNGSSQVFTESRRNVLKYAGAGMFSLAATGRAAAKLPGDPTKDTLIEQKQGRIYGIQDLAGIEIGFDEAARRVDQRAQVLLNDIKQDRLGVSDRQYRRALLRMNAAEAVTETSTRTVVGNDSPAHTISENLYSFVTGAAAELLSYGAGKIIGRVLGSILDDVTGFLDDLADSAKGSGVLPDSATDDITRKINDFKRSQAARSEDAIQKNKDDLQDVIESPAGPTAARFVNALESLTDKQNLLDTSDEFLFRTYYFYPELPSVHIPDPDTIKLPEVNVSYDVPNEMLPAWLQGIPPDKITVDTGELPQLSAVPVLGDIASLADQVSEVRNDVNEGGVNPTISARMDYIDSNIASLLAQNKNTRNQIRNLATDGISAVETLVNDLNYVLEEIVTKVLEDASLGLIALAGFVTALAGIVAVTGIGAVPAGVLLGAAGTLATVAGYLSLMVLVVDAIQIASGFGFAVFDSEIHQITTYLLAETDLGGVSI